HRGKFRGRFTNRPYRRLLWSTDMTNKPEQADVHTWSYAQHENRYVDVADTLRMANMRQPC
ncbi:MAG: hypothetical protein SH847_04265, partial [Roseiflexaceae bacterium]|nr:hypothetical protein [Roseiflexaceae bacterium]